MSKIAKNIKMLDILSTGKKYTCKELSNILEITPREVRSYKNELEKNGIYIDSYYGKDGGYKLRSKLELPTILFSNDDLDKLEIFINKYKTLDSIGDIIDIKNKIKEFCNIVNEETLSVEKAKLEIFNDFKNSILNKKSIKIEYFSKGEKKIRTVIPKQIYAYNNNIMIIVQYSNDINDIRHLNINRINRIIK